MAMWRLEEDGAGLKWEGWDEVAATAEMMEGLEPEAAEVLERAMTALDGTALNLARKGLIGADNKQLLVMLGMTKTGAGKAAQGTRAKVAVECKMDRSFVEGFLGSKICRGRGEKT